MIRKIQHLKFTCDEQGRVIIADTRNRTIQLHYCYFDGVWPEGILIEGRSPKQVMLHTRGEKK